MTTIEQRLMQALGELQFQNIVMSHQMDEMRQQITDLEAAASAKDQGADSKPKKRQ